MSDEDDPFKNHVIPILPQGFGFRTLGELMKIKMEDDAMTEKKEDSFENAVNELLWYAEATHICNLDPNSYNATLLYTIMKKHKEAFIEKWRPCKKEE